MEKSGERNVKAGTVTGPRGPQPATSYRFSHYNVITTPQVGGKKRLFALFYICALIIIKVAASSLFLFLFFLQNFTI